MMVTTEEPMVEISAAPKLRVQGVSKHFKTQKGMVHALDNVSLTVGEGEFVCLVGPSGCGKSTLLNLVAGLDFPDEGQILADGKPVTGPGSDRMVMFQENAIAAGPRSEEHTSEL